MSEVDMVYEGPWLVAAGTDGNRRFGALLKDLREISSFSPQELAKRVGVHVSFVRGIERGAQAPSMETARLMLGFMKGRIKWMEDGPFDLLVRDPKTGRYVAFDFKAKVKGQNRRFTVDPVRLEADLTKLTAAVDPFGTTARLSKLAKVVEEAADDARLGRVVRMLALADEETLRRVEGLLRDELAPPVSGP